jgi:N-acetylglucosamine-6-sulfatase
LETIQLFGPFLEEVFNLSLGSFERVRNSGPERSTVATWLDDTGYDPAYVGKYLNGYGEGKPTRYVPPGWDR